MKTLRLQAPEKSEVPKFNVGAINDQFEQLTIGLGLFSLPKFDAGLSDFSRYDVKTIVRATISHRATNKWERPDPTTVSARRKNSIAGWHATESRLKNLDKRAASSVLYRARNTGNRVCYEIGMKVLKQLKKPISTIDFGPGESFVSRQGDTSILAKLEPMNHSVSFDNLDLWVNLIVSTRGLLMPYIEYWHRHLKARVLRKTGVFNNNVVPIMRTDLLTKGDWKRAIVLQVIDSIPGYVVQGSRQAFVDKDNSEDRAIEVNPLGDVVLQKVVGMAFRVVLLEYGIDLDNNQSLHRDLIQDKTLATIDASKASDTITADHLRWAFPPALVDILIQLSQEFILATDENGNRQWFKQYKLCSMGSGFTFELLTTLFYSIGRLHTDSCWAYGDDLIVPRESAKAVVEDLTKVGFIINHKKTFLEGPLSESCGGFHLEFYGYITCYSLKYCNNAVEAVASVNKLRRIVEHYIIKFGRDDFSDLLENVHKNCVQIIHPAFIGPLSNSTDIPNWVESSNYDKRHKKSAFLRSIRKRNLDLIEMKAFDFQMAIDDFTLVLIPEIVNEVRLSPRAVVKYKPLVYSYIKTSIRTKFEIKTRNPRVVIKLRLLDKRGIFMI